MDLLFDSKLVGMLFVVGVDLLVTCLKCLSQKRSVKEQIVDQTLLGDAVIVPVALEVGLHVLIGQLHLRRKALARQLEETDIRPFDLLAVGVGNLTVGDEEVL